MGTVSFVLPIFELVQKISSHRHRQRRRRRPAAHLQGRRPDALLPASPSANRQRRRRRRQRPLPRPPFEPGREPSDRPRVRVRRGSADVGRQQRERAEQGVAVAVVPSREPSRRRGDALASDALAVFNRAGRGRAADAPDPRGVARPLVREAPLEPVAVVVEPVVEEKKRE